MRLSGFGTLTMGMFLLDAAEATSRSDATSWLVRALRTASRPWISGVSRDQLATQLANDRWETVDGVRFTRSGSWGEVSVVLQDGRPGARACAIGLRSDDERWPMITASTAIHAWIARTYPQAERDPHFTTKAGDEELRVTRWTDASVSITQTLFQTKQPAAGVDLVLLVEAPA